MLTLSYVNENPHTWNHPECPVCHYMMYQTFTEAPGLTFKEGMDVESSKPGSYWRNAEKVRIKERRKRIAEEREKLAYGDPEAVAKRDNFKRNVAAMNDTSPDNIIIKQDTEDD